jgi:hypothetical protein
VQATGVASDFGRLLQARPEAWAAAAGAWRRLAGWTGHRDREFAPLRARLQATWSGSAADAAGVRVRGLQRAVRLTRLSCWTADQALSEFAADLARARAVLDVALAAARRHGLTVTPDGQVHPPTAPIVGVTAPPGSGVSGGVRAHGSAGAAGGAGAGGGAGTRGGAGAGGAGGRGTGPGTGVAGHGARLSAADVQQAVQEVVRSIEVALRLVAEADVRAATRLRDIAAGLASNGLGAGGPAGTGSAGTGSAGPGTAGLGMPGCGAAPADVRRWWDGLSPAQRHALLAAEPAAIGSLDGVPVADRDLANRLRLDDQRADVDRAITAAHDDGERRRLRGLRDGLDFLARRLDDDEGRRAYLLRLGLDGEGRAVVALGDPDQADNVVTHVPGMTADLASLRSELVRAERVATRAEQLAPDESTSGVLWLDYDAPDFVDEAAGAGRARAASDGLHRFLDGLRVTHDGSPAHQTVIGHSYGSLVVGTAAADARTAADSLVFVGSPGVGVDRAADLHMPAGQVWAATSLTDVIQYAAVSPGAMVSDTVRAAVLGPLVAYGLPEDDLWFGRNPGDVRFGAQVFGAQADAGHLGYWDPGRPALDNLARIALGGEYQQQVTRR